ncbi:hypothetical protein PIROE2DRAFT_4567 [Piromyces sp. E2]|nr:hypothetical protein PIROE2DRAFT_4567 [Piromyces sp. E2]|eukprot:OUM67888.1 hypothetical protein PIROE2DRAFT_4567 [Piromyces sp. E2]
MFQEQTLKSSQEIHQKINKYISILQNYYKLNDYQYFLQLLFITDNFSVNKEISNYSSIGNNNDNNNNIDDEDVTKLELVITKTDNNIQNNFPKEIILAPLFFSLGPDLETEYTINLTEMTLPMFHVNQVKDHFRDDFIYKITGQEDGALKDFITKVKLLDKRVYNLIQHYIKNIKPSSPIYPLLKKNGVTETSHWNFYGIINGPDQDYLHISYKKSPIEQDIEGTPIYIGDEPFYDMENVLSLNSYCFVHGQIYPILKLKDIIVEEHVLHDTPVVSFHCKAFFTEIYFKLGTVNCTTKAG